MAEEKKTKDVTWMEMMVNTSNNYILSQDIYTAHFLDLIVIN